MYIFKAAKMGGVVTSHQDGTFFYTRPQQTVVGLWIALHDAHEGNAAASGRGQARTTGRSAGGSCATRW